MIVGFAFSAAKRRGLWRGVFGLGVLALAGALYWYWSAPPLNIILVTLDTTRADRLGAYGYKPGLTKGFDDFAKRGVVFDRAYAPAPITLPSHATMLTGLYPPEHGLRVNGAGRLDDSIPLLPEILKEHGYDTGAFIAAVVLDSRYGLERGFDVYEDDLSKARSVDHHGEPRRDGQQVIDLALAWLQQRTTRPFFCWIHLYDAHAPYDSRPQLFGQKFVDNPYDAGVAREIQQFERLTNYLKTRKLDERTLVVVVGDHGEGLDEHMEVEHGMLVYNTTLEVPLAFVGPRDCRPGTRVAEAVSLTDLTPTLLDMLHLPTPKHVSGRSLRAALNGGTIAPRDVYAEAETPFLHNRWAPLHAVVSNRWKYIHTTRPELYDLEHDPGELTNLAESNVEQSADLRAALEILQKEFVPASAQNITLTEKDRANLRALGYVSGGNAAVDSGDSSDAQRLPDIKDMLPFLAKFERARDISLRGQLAEAIALLKQVAEGTREFPMAELLLADCLAEAGRMDEATTTYRTVIARRPDFVRAHFSLGRILASQNQFEPAVEEFREFLKQSPEAATGYFELGQALRKWEKFDDAISAYREAIRIAPEFVVANLQLGKLLASLGRAKEAEACFEQALRYAPGSAEAHANLMTLYEQNGTIDKAIEQGKQAVALDPTDFETRLKLGMLLVAQARYAEGITELRAARRLRADDPRLSEQILRAEAALKKSGR